MEERVFRHNHRVTYHECTLGNHIYYARYLDILEEARGEFARAMGFPLKGLQESEVIFPVIEARLKYLAPARYDDLLTIEVTVRQATRVRIEFGYRVLREDTLLVEGGTWHVCTSPDEKPKRMPVEVAERLQQMVLPGEVTA